MLAKFWNSDLFINTAQSRKFAPFIIIRCILMALIESFPVFPL